jgi:small subunit ribosomal protein S4
MVTFRKVNICSYIVKIGDKITVKKADKSKGVIKQQLESNPNFTTQSWLELDRDEPKATIVDLPTREDIQIPIEEQLVIEFCSR